MKRRETLEEWIKDWGRVWYMGPQMTKKWSRRECLHVWEFQFLGPFLSTTLIYVSSYYLMALFLCRDH